MLTINEMTLLRIHLGMTLSNAALLMGTTKQTISNIELGKSKRCMTMLFYEKTLLGVLLLQDGNTYEQHLERQITKYTKFLESHKKQSL